MKSNPKMNEQSYLDHHWLRGYLTDIREVPNDGEPFLACNIRAQHGRPEKPMTSFYDCIVTGEEAQDLVRRCKQAVEKDQEVQLGFQASGLWVKPYINEKGDNAGKPGAVLKVWLLAVDWIMKNGESVFGTAPEISIGESATPKQGSGGSKSQASARTQSNKSSSASAKGKARNNQAAGKSF